LFFLRHYLTVFHLYIPPFYPPFLSSIDNRSLNFSYSHLPLPAIHLLTLLLSSSKQTDFRNVASSRPYLRHSPIFASTRRRRRRHLSHMRRCLHVQQQTRPSACSPRIQQSSDPHSNLTSDPSFAICPYTRYHRHTVENKTHYSSCPSLTESSSSFRRPHIFLPKATQKHRRMQSNKAPRASLKGWRSRNHSTWCFLKSEGQKGPQAPILGQRHDSSVKASHDSWRHR